MNKESMTLLERLEAIGIQPGRHPRYVDSLDSILRSLNERVAETLGPLNESDRLFWSQFVAKQPPEIVSLVLIDAIQLRTPLSFVVSILRVSF